ncbi:hypothetical protein HRH25_23565 [Flavisolibacter sp. BT320]|nr:hypothetical protein [Flavisolibacter longurius]
MTTIVTALMYSGRPNPSWELTPEQAEELKSLLAEKREHSEVPAFTAILGYRGFSIESYDPSIPSKASFFDGIVDISDQENRSFIDRNSSLESFLLDTASNALTVEEKSFIQGEISKNSKGGPASISNSLHSAIELLAVPPFNPGKWNIPSVQPYNNCYNYANDKITNTFAQPGRGSGSTIANILCPTVSQAAQRDGQIPVTGASSTPSEGHFIALVSANHPNFQDYHWYRLDANGMWSHKPGQTPAINIDNSGQLINDPRNCNRGPYSDFCGFFHCIPSRTTIR